MGSVLLNLSEFAGERMVQKKILLRDSNVNSILRVWIGWYNTSCLTGHHRHEIIKRRSNIFGVGRFALVDTLDRDQHLTTTSWTWNV